MLASTGIHGEGVGARDADVQHAEAVGARLHAALGPRHAVHQDNVTVGVVVKEPAAARPREKAAQGQ